jgi:hypothetical protein
MARENLAWAPFPHPVGSFNVKRIATRAGPSETAGRTGDGKRFLVLGYRLFKDGRVHTWTTFFMTEKKVLGMVLRKSQHFGKRRSYGSER